MWKQLGLLSGIKHTQEGMFKMVCVSIIKSLYYKFFTNFISSTNTEQYFT